MDVVSPRVRDASRRPERLRDGLLIVAGLALVPVALLGIGPLLALAGLLIGALIVVGSARRPDLAIPVLVVVLAVQVPVLAFALRLGAPTMAVRAGGFAKDLIVAGLLTAALAAIVVRRQPLDRLDRVGLAFVVLTGVYLVIGLAGPRIGRDLFPHAPDGTLLQLVSFRALAVGILVFIAVRSFGIGVPGRRRLLAAVAFVSVVLAAGALVEVVVPDWWERFAVVALGIPEYQRRVFDIDLVLGVVVYTELGGRLLVRAGSLLFDYLQLGFFLVPALVLGLVRAARRGAVADWLLVGVVGAGIVGTLTRSALLAAAVGFAVALVLAPPGRGRRNLQVVALVGVLAVAVVAVPTGLAARLGAVVQGPDPSTAEHLDSLAEGIAVVRAQPLGLGLGTGAATHARGDGVGVVSENAYLEVAIQTGVMGGALFVATLLLLLVALVRRRPRTSLTIIAAASVAGLFAGGMLLHVWTMLEATWVVFALAGAALPRTE